MDISTLAAKESAVLHLRGADDELLFDNGVPVTVTCFGPGSKAYQKAQATSQNKLIDRMKRKGNVDQTPDEKLAQQAEFLTACTESFDGLTSGTFTGPDLFRAVYSDPEVGFISEQVAKFIGDWSNFTKASTTA